MARRRIRQLSARASSELRKQRDAIGTMDERFAEAVSARAVIAGPVVQLSVLTMCEWHGESSKEEKQSK